MADGPSHQEIIFAVPGIVAGDGLVWNPFPFVGGGGELYRLMESRADSNEELAAITLEANWPANLHSHSTRCRRSNGAS